MKSATRSRFPKLFPGISWEYYIIENPFRKVRALPTDEETPVKETITNYGSRQVTRREAMQYIEDNGLVLAHKTKDGEIYDLPGQPFRDMFHIETKKQRDEIEKIWD